MNSTSIRESIVSLRSGVRVVANLVTRSYYQSLRNANSVQRSCYSTFRSFRSSKSCGCLVEAKRYQAIKISLSPAAMPGKGKNKQKSSKKQKQGQNATPNTDQPSPDKSESLHVDAGSHAPESQSPNGQNRMEVRDESQESGAVSEVNPTKADNESESPVMGGALAIETEQKLEKAGATEGGSSLKPTASEENAAKPDAEVEENVTLASSAVVSNIEVEEDKKRDEALQKQSHDKTVGHQVSQPSGKTEGEMKSGTENKESSQVKGTSILSSPGSKWKSSGVNKDTPSKTSSNEASNQGRGAFKLSDSPRQEYYGKTSVMKERDRFLAMTPKEKRNRFYSRKTTVMTLEDIDTWKEYYSDNEKFLKKICPEEAHIKMLFKGGFPRHDVDDEFNAKVSIYEGDITLLEIDGIVNAANSSLQGGGGVDGSIHRAAGGLLLEECMTLSGCKTGDAKTTCAYRLPAKYIIHTVGPRGNYPNDLKNCYNRCLDEMLKHNMRSIAFCCVSTGIYGYPNDLAVHVALTTVREWLGKLKKSNQLDVIDRVIFCLFLQIDVCLYQKWMQIYFPIHRVNGADKETPDNTIVAEVPSDSDCTPKEGESEDDPQASASYHGDATLPGMEGKEEEGLKSSTSGQEVASMEVEDIVEEDMEAEEGSTGSSQVGGTVSPDKKCKMDPGTPKVPCFER